MDNEDLKKKAADGAEKAKETAGKAKDKAKEFYGKAKESGLVKKISEKTKLGANAVMGIAGGIVLVLLVVIIAVANHKSPEERLAREYAKAAKVAAKTLGADDFSDVKSALKAVDTAAKVVQKVSSTGKSSKKENKVKFATKPDPETDFVYDLTADGQGIVITGYKYDGYEPREISIPETIEGYPVIELGDSAFKSTPVESIVVPQTVQKVGSFYERVTSLDPMWVDINTEKLKYIGRYAFQSVKFANTKVVLSDGCVIEDPPMNITRDSCAFAGSNITSIVLPEGLERIPDRAFEYCSELKSVTLPSTLKGIGERAFQECKKLESITFPKSLKEIGDRAFFSCENLKEVNIPDGVKYDFPGDMGDNNNGAFEMCTSLNLKQRAAIKATGYTGTFSD